MKVYLAGVQGGSKSFIVRQHIKKQEEQMKIFLAGTYSRKYVFEDLKYENLFSGSDIGKLKSCMEKNGEDGDFP